MTLLLDTHTILWMTEDVPSLGRAAKTELRRRTRRR